MADGNRRQPIKATVGRKSPSAKIVQVKKAKYK